MSTIKDSSSSQEDQRPSAVRSPAAGNPDGSPQGSATSSVWTGGSELPVLDPAHPLACAREFRGRSSTLRPRCSSIRSRARVSFGSGPRATRRCATTTATGTPSQSRGAPMSSWNRQASARRCIASWSGALSGVVVRTTQSSSRSSPAQGRSTASWMRSDRSCICRPSINRPAGCPTRPIAAGRHGIRMMSSPSRTASYTCRHVR